MLRNLLSLLTTLLLAVPLANAARPERIDFEDLRLGRAFRAGDRFMDSGLQIVVEPTLKSDGTPVMRGRAEVVGRPNRAGGSGLEMFLDPYNLRFEFPYRPGGLTLLFSESGVGNVNLAINGDFRNGSHFVEFNGATLGGVKVHVLGGAKDQKGVLELAGEIRTLVIGGYEVFIDNVTPWIEGEPIYFTDCGRRPGEVREFRPDTMSQTVLYRRASADLDTFAFAPWDPHRLYVVNASDRTIAEVALAVSKPTESVVYTHSTYVRDIAFDGEGRLYFSEASGSGADGKIYRINASGTAQPFFTVALSEIDGFWSGNFAFADDGKLLLSSGNVKPAALYEADLTTGKLTKVFSSPSEAMTGFAPSGSAVFFSNNAKKIQRLMMTAAGVAKDLVLEDASAGRLCDVGFRASVPGGTALAGNWVMPFGIRGFRLDQIKSTGLIDYTDTASGIAMNDAPFGGGLAFLLNSASAFPTPDVYYYRFSYRRSGASGWNDFTAPVSVRYVKYRPGLTPVFPKLALGPKEVNGLNLYRFRPHESDLAPLVGAAAGEVEWPKNPFPGDVYRGYLDTVDLSLAPGKYEIRLEVYNHLGVKTTPAPGVFEMIVPTGVDASGGLLTAPAALVSGGAQFAIHIDNRPAMAALDDPTIGSTAVDSCGFLRYSTDSPGTVRLGWTAWHDGKFAVYRLNIVRGASGIGSLPLPPAPGDPTPAVALPIAEEVASTAHHADGAGGFYEMSPTDRLLAGCDEAAFAASLRVYAKATTGNGYRITQYDASALRAFAIAPYWP